MCFLRLGSKNNAPKAQQLFRKDCLCCLNHAVSKPSLAIIHKKHPRKMIREKEKIKIIK